MQSIKIVAITIILSRETFTYDSFNPTTPICNPSQMLYKTPLSIKKTIKYLDSRERCVIPQNYVHDLSAAVREKGDGCNFF